MLCAVALRADDCNGTSYDPASQGCCNGQVYDLATQECCGDGTVATIGQCPQPPPTCNGVPYDPATQECCSDSRIVSIGQCEWPTCNGVPYDYSTQACCGDGRIVPIGQCEWPTCNGVSYDPGSQECCGIVIVPIGQCCSGQPFDPGTQDCCTDGRIVSKGQCDPPPMCNNEPFDPVTQECCGSMIVPLGQCCNGTSYDPSSQGCCNGQVYTLGQICCGGTVYNPWDMAGGVGCCNDQVYDISLSGLGCCNGQFYTLSDQDCCSDNTLAPAGQCGWQTCAGAPYDPSTQGCCEGQLYSLASQECCSGTLVTLGNCCNGTAFDPGAQGCCNNQLYDLMSQECCSGALVAAGSCCNGTPFDPSSQGCCNGQLYDSMTQECCGGVVVSPGQCCNGQPFDPGMQGCCNGQVYTPGSQDCCSDGRVVTSGQCEWLTCAGVPYDSATQGCCNGQIYETATQECCGDGTVALIGQCPLPPPMCGETPYDSTSQGCCNGVVYSLSSQCCVNGMITGLTSMGNCPSVCGNSTYDPAFSDCCNDQVYDLASQTCCGGAVVSNGQCCNGVPFDPATHDCCGDGTIAPKDYCGWPICGGVPYDPNYGLACCNGQTYNPSTQICCDGTDVVDIGQCHPSLCNNVPFDPSIYECCNGEIIALGYCCAGQLINPATQGCGGGTTIYDLATQDYCPDGRVVPKGQCYWPTCSGTPYDSMVNECCSDGSLAAIGQCPPPPALCNGVPYNPPGEECCADGRVVPSGQCNWPTCNGTPYDPETQDCCSNGTVASKNECNDTADCNGTIYNPNNYECCGGQTIVPIGRCCSDMNGNWAVYDPATQDCCGGAWGMLVAPRGNCPIDCGGIWINPATTGCCQSEPYLLATHKCCGTPTVHVAPIGEVCMADCNGTLYNPDTHQCCYNQVIPQSAPCYPECSPGVTYNPDTQGCCNSLVYTLATQECCYNEVVNKGECPELSVTINTDGGKPCVTGIGNPVAFIASASNAFGTVTYQWDFGGGSTTRTEGEGPINATFDWNGQAGVSVTATDTFTRGNETFQRFAYTNVIVNIAKITFVHANADGTAGAPMDYIPIWTPNDGVDKGPPILDSPAPVFQMTPAGGTMSATLLGVNYTLARDATDTLLYTDSSSGLTVRLNQQPLNDPNVQEYLEATVSLPSAGITNSLYACDETAADSSIFAYTPPGLVATVGVLGDSQPDTIALTIYRNSAASYTMTETGANTLVFTNNATTASLLGNPSGSSPLVVAVTSSGSTLSNTVVSLAPYGGSVYRNFAPPILTSLPAESVPSDASFYVQVQAADLGAAANQPVKIKMDTDGGDQEIVQLNLSQIGDGVWLSEKPLVLCSSDADTSQMISSDQTSYHAVLSAQNAKLDWTAGGGKITASLSSSSGSDINSSTNAQPGGVVLQSFNWWWELQVRLGGAFIGLSLDPETKIRQPFKTMGYTMLRDYHADSPTTLNKYISGRQIWYSLSHGAFDVPSEGLPSGKTYANYPFIGLVFYDGSGICTASLGNKRLDYRLVIANACGSAQTSTTSRDAAANKMFPLLPDAQALADAFGPNVAYVGWAWEINPFDEEDWASEFVNYLVGGKTVNQAFQAYRGNHQDTSSDAILMRLYTKGQGGSLPVDLYAPKNN